MFETHIDKVHIIRTWTAGGIKAIGLSTRILSRRKKMKVNEPVE